MKVRRIFLIVLAGCLAAVGSNKIIFGLVGLFETLAAGYRPRPFVNSDIRGIVEGIYGMRLILSLAIFDFLCCMTEKRYTMSMFACSVALLVLTVLTIVFQPYTQDLVSALYNTLDDPAMHAGMIPIVTGEALILAAYAALGAVYILSKTRMKRDLERHYHADAPRNAFRRAVFLSLTAAVLTVCIIRLCENISVLMDGFQDRRPPMNRYVVGVGEAIYLLRYVFALTAFDFLCCWTEKTYTMPMFACSVAIFTLTALTIFLTPATEAAILRVFTPETVRQEFWGQVSLLAGMGILLTAYLCLTAVYILSKARLNGAKDSNRGSNGLRGFSCCP